MKAVGRQRSRTGRRLLGLLFGALLASGTGAQELDPHAFEVRGGAVEIRDGVVTLDADIEFALSEAASEALDSGVPLTFVLDIQVVRPRRFWPDDQIAALVQRYQVRYHALSQRYVLNNLNAGAQHSYATREGVLQALGRVRELPVIDRRRLDAGRDYQLWLRVGLDVDALPAPLKTAAYLSPEWRLLSEWEQWRFEA